MIRRPLIFVGDMCLLTTVVHADDPLACLDPAVADTLLAKPNEGPHAVSYALPDDFPQIELPGEFELIGSRTLLQRSVVAFKSSLSQSQAVARLESVLLAEGWQRSAESSLPGQGFQLSVREAAATTMQICKSSERRVSAQAFPASGGRETYLTLTAATRHFGEGCDRVGTDPRPQHTLPVLDLPSTGTGSVAGNILGSEGETTSLANLESSLSAAEILEHFAQQLVRQSWYRVALWSEDIVAGSAWVSEDQRTNGLLTVLGQKDGSYQLRFEVLDGRGHGSRGAGP